MDKIINIKQIRDFKKADYIIKKNNDESFEKFKVFKNNKNSEIIEIIIDEQKMYNSNLFSLLFDKVNIGNLKKDYKLIIEEGTWWK